MFTHLSIARCVLLCAAAVILPSSAAGQPIKIAAGLELSQVYRPRAWQPVVIDLHNDTDQAVEGSVVLPLADEQPPAAMSLPVSVPAHSMVRTSIWGYFPPQLKLTAQQKRAGQTPPLSIAEWRGRDGSLLSRAELHGLPLSTAPGNVAGDGEGGEMVLVVDRRSSTTSESYDLQSLLAQLSESAGVPIQLAAVEPSGVSRHATVLRTLKAIVLEGVDPETIDVAQREALVEYVRGGGVLVLAAPMHPWPMLPVQIVGTRMARQIGTTPGGPTLKLRELTTIVEAVDAGGEVILRDRDYVHAAVRKVGLGRIVFTSFPINALVESQPQVAAVWEQLFSLKHPQWDWNQSPLGEQRYRIVGSMIGRKVAPWSLAAALAGGYLLLILAAQSMFTGPARPKAFVVSVAGALLLSGALVVMAVTRRADESLQAGRLAVIDVAPDGGGWAQETVAFTGADDPHMSLEAADERVAIRPALADPGNRPVIRQQPFAVQKAGVSAERIERVWEASMPVASQSRLQAVARFGEKGLTLDVDNGLQQSIESPLLLFDRRALSLANLPAGKSTITQFGVNARDDFSSGGVLTSEQMKRRAQVVRASLPSNAQGDQPPTLIGWLSQPPAGGLLRPEQRNVADARTMAMVRTPLRIEPSPVGSKVAVPAALVRLNPGRLPYDRAKAETVPSQEQGVWLVNFAIPTQVGQVRPARGNLDVRLALPQHTMIVRKGQCLGGSAKINRNGDVVAEWSREVGQRQASLSFAPGDYDAEGRIWLLLQVSGQSGAAPTGSWQIKELAVGIDEAEVIAPPRPLDLGPATRPNEKDEQE